MLDDFSDLRDSAGMSRAGGKSDTLDDEAPFTLALHVKLVSLGEELDVLL